MIGWRKGEFIVRGDWTGAGEVLSGSVCEVNELVAN